MSIHEECGVFGIYDPAGDCARTTYYGLYSLQHRGQEACGIATINDRELSYHKDLGLVGDVFHQDVLDRLGGTMAVGHVRYSTTGYGYHVMIDHGGGFVTLYAHCSKLLVAEGQQVQAGDIIAEVGSTGRSTGNHLHFEVRINGEKQNPRSYLP